MICFLFSVWLDLTGWSQLKTRVPGLSIQVSFFQFKSCLGVEGNWKWRRGSKETTGLYVVHLDRHSYFRFNFILNKNTRLSFRMDDFRHFLLSCWLPNLGEGRNPNGFFSSYLFIVEFFHSSAFSVWLSVGLCECVGKCGSIIIPKESWKLCTQMINERWRRWAAI